MVHESTVLSLTTKLCCKMVMLLYVLIFLHHVPLFYSIPDVSLSYRPWGHSYPGHPAKGMHRRFIWNPSKLPSLLSVSERWSLSDLTLASYTLDKTSCLTGNFPLSSLVDIRSVVFAVYPFSSYSALLYIIHRSVSMSFSNTNWLRSMHGKDPFICTYKNCNITLSG